MGRLLLILVFSAGVALGQQSTGTLKGQVSDEFGGVIVGATIVAVNASGVEKTVTTNGEGNFFFNGLAPGKYTIRATAIGFANFENADVEAIAGRTQLLPISLKVTIEQQKVTVAADTAGVNTEPENNVGATILKGADLESLPDDPDDLAAALQALAGPGAGPNGGQIYIDGLSGGRLPPKESIREVRINQNPFSSEYEKLGYGRIEIFTKPGTDKYRGNAFFEYGNDVFNSRNPFAPTKAPYEHRQFGGNVSGPISKKSSFFIDVERRSIDDNEVINATILDPNFNITPYSATVLDPNRRTTVSPRIDYQLNPSNTLVGRYTYSQSSRLNGGVGEFALESRAINTDTTQHTVQLTETAV